MGRYADTPAPPNNDPNVGGTLLLLARNLARQPAPERYETLREWTLPTATRRAVRILSGLGGQAEPPSVFAKGSPLSGEAPARDADSVFSTATALIEAAREVGSLDALAAAVQPAAAEKIENAELLSGLIVLAKGDAGATKALVQARREEMIKENEAAANQV